MGERRLKRFRFSVDNKFFDKLCFNVFGDDVRLALYAKGVDRVVGLLELTRRFLVKNVDLFFPECCRKSLHIEPLDGKIRQKLINAILFERKHIKVGTIPNGQGRKKSNHLEKQGGNPTEPVPCTIRRVDIKDLAA